MDPTISRLDFYLKVNDVQNFINRNTPSALAQSTKTIVSSLFGASIGGAIGKYALPLIEEAFPGTLETAREHALSVLKPAFEYLAPSIPSTNYIPIALAGIGGVLVFGFTFYRQANLSAQVAVAKAALGTKQDKLVTDSELKDLQSFLPSYKLENSARAKLVIEDEEINKFVAIKDCCCANIVEKAISNDDLRDLSSYQKISHEDFKKHPDIISLILETNILHLNTATKMLNDNIPDYKRKNMDRLWMWPPIAYNNRENIRNLLKSINQEIYDLDALKNTWDALNTDEREVLIDLLNSPELDEKKVKGALSILQKFEIDGESQEDKVPVEFERKLNVTL